jgi:hypothetical protein
MASVNKSGVYANEHREPPNEGTVDVALPNLEIIKVDHQSVLLSWKEISNQKSYIIEEKDEYGIGRVWVGTASQCLLQGLETLSSHLYRLVMPTPDGQITSKWINVLTTREPITADYITRACRSTDLPRLQNLLAEVTNDHRRGKDLLNSLDSKGVTPLMMCAQEGFTEGICLLLQHEAEIDKVNNDGRTALMWACFNGHTKAVNLLIENGADLKLKDRSGKNCLFCACDSDHPSTLLAILEKNIIPVNTYNSSGWTVLHKLAAVYDTENSPKMLKLLLKYGANINLRDNKGNTPLLLGAISGNVSIVKTLLDMGSSLTLSNEKGNTPVTLATSPEFVSKGGRSKQIAELIKTRNSRKPI